MVDGDPLHMSTGDLLLTPSMKFHEHHNSGDAPMTWLDVLDLPTVAALEAIFYEDGPTEDADARTTPVSASEGLFGGGPGLLPVLSGKVAGAEVYARHSPLLAYRWVDTERALEAQLEVSGACEATVRYVNPATGSDVMPTMRCEMNRLRAGNRGHTAKRTGSRVVMVFQGHGSARVGAETFQLDPGDIFVVPSWAEYGLEADGQLDVFSTSDAPILEALGLYREMDGG